MSMQLRRNAASPTCRTSRATLFLALRTELRLGERVSLNLEDGISREWETDSNQLHFQFLSPCETNEPPAHFIDLSHL